MKQPWQRYVLLAVALFVSVLIVYHFKLSLSLLWPTNNSLMFSGDWAQHYLSWEMFRALPWQFPLGTLTNYFYPLATNIGYTDAIPLFAFLFKLLSPILPQDFQYIGLWLLLCFLLQAWFAVLLLRAFKLRSTVALFAGAMLFVLSPILLFRIGHPALCAQWLIVASLWIYFRDNTTQAARPIIYQGALLLLSAFIHPYLTVIVFNFTAIYLIRLFTIDKTIRLTQLIVFLIIAVVIVLVSWYVIGYFSLPAKDAWETGGGFATYATNLLGLINPFEYSSLLPNIPLSMVSQREGFAYLGLGILLLIATIIILKIVSRDRKMRSRKIDWPKSIPLMILVTGFTLFSLSNTINMGSHILFTYSLPNWTMRLTDTFRAAGRFIWVLYYVIFALIFYTLSRLHISQKWLAIILVTTLLIQVIDITPLINTTHHTTAGRYQSTLSAEWSGVVQNANLLVMYPPFQQDYLTPGDYVKFVYLAHQHQLAITTGYLARYDAKTYANYLSTLQIALHTGKPEQNTVYITTPAHEADFAPWLNKNLVTKMNLDGYVVFLNTKSLLNLIW